jgi:protein gp37
MSANSAIEWTNNSWNPLRARNLKTGKFGWHCEHATTGCINCYAEGFNFRFGTGLPFKPGHRDDIEIFLDEKMLTAPMRWKKPGMIFVCSMTDLFADFVPDAWLDKIFAVMALCPQHTFQVLTKRAERMRKYFATWPMTEEPDRITEIAADIAYKFRRGWQGCAGQIERPLSNVWLGTSCERQEEADARIPALLATPAAVWFVSAEPLLASIDLRNLRGGTFNGFDGIDHEDIGDIRDPGVFHKSRYGKLDWVIVGGESGPSARDLWVPDVRGLVRQCQAADVPVFVKQLGAQVYDRADGGFDGCPPGAWPKENASPCRLRLKDRKGGDPNEWPEDLRVRQWPTVARAAVQATLV